MCFYNPPPTEIRRTHASKEIWRSIDYIGLAILVAGLVILIVPLIQGGASYPWNSGRIIAMLVIGPCLLITFGLFGEWIFTLQRQKFSNFYLQNGAKRQMLSSIMTSLRRGISLFFVSLPLLMEWCCMA